MLRSSAGIIDRSGYGRLSIYGGDRLTWLQGMVSNDMRRLNASAPRMQACVLNATGHLLSDIDLIHIPSSSRLAAALGSPNADSVLAELPAENIAKIAAVFDRFLIVEDVEIEDVSARILSLSVQGPEAAPEAILAALGELAQQAITVPADHTGLGGVDLYFPASAREAIIAAFKSRSWGIVSPETAEMLRIEAGIPRYDVDMDESTIPLEANLGPTHISLTKGCYVGQEIIARIDSRGHTNRALTGLVFAPDAVPKSGDRLFAASESGEKETGRVTSVTPYSDLFDGKPIGLGYLRHEHGAAGSELTIRTEAGDVTAKVVALPFR